MLPFLPLSQGTVDYEVDRRNDPGLIKKLLNNTAAQLMLVSGGKVAVPHGQGAVAQAESVKLRLAMIPATYMRDFIEASQRSQQSGTGTGSATNLRSPLVVFLGTKQGNAAKSYLSLTIPTSALKAAEESATSHATPGTHAGEPLPGSLLGDIVRKFDWVDLRDFAPRASSLEAGLATSAVSVSNWQSYQRFCPQCGARVSPANAGWAQRCTNPDHGEILFPRIEPAVITAVTDSQDRILLQHNKAWKNPKLMSVSAGFVEAGENLEHAVRRETMEEVGITLGDLAYEGSQPWPFQRSLMVAFKARALTTDIHVDGVEVDTARWFSRDEFTMALANGEFELPTRAAVARYQIQEWYGQEL
ncbi:MAG: NAD(+) diphosphatase [Bifidobacteriaceae bacterium]|nr:NAD(+) diphosphatase [Bifidobacteriaceae bacterium]